MSSMSEQYAAFQMTGGGPGETDGNDPVLACASCGSPDIYLESPAEGWSCRSCGASDSDGD
jgi:hypothetical protein